MVRRLAGSGAGVQVVVGKAGSGKTTALAVTREIFESAGYFVSGTAVSARAAEELEVSARIPSVTLARLLGELDDGPACSVPARSGRRRGWHGRHPDHRPPDRRNGSVGALLILVGTLASWPRSRPAARFRALAHRLGAIELNENRRQHEAWERRALDELRSGDVVKALLAYEAHDRIRISATMAAVRIDLVERWMDARDSGFVMLAVNRRDVDDLKPSPGRSSSSAACWATRSCAPRRDRLPCPTRWSACAMPEARGAQRHPGHRGWFDADGLHIETTGGPRVLPTRYIESGHLAHGYATTVHKAQGATYDRAFVLATDSLTREAGYVAMSRARSGTELFVISGAFEDGPGADMGKDEPMARTAARLAISRAKSMASEHLTGGLPANGRSPATSPRTAQTSPATSPRTLAPVQRRRPRWRLRQRPRPPRLRLAGPVRRHRGSPAPCGRPGRPSGLCQRAAPL